MYSRAYLSRMMAFAVALFLTAAAAALAARKCNAYDISRAPLCHSNLAIAGSGMRPQPTIAASSEFGGSSHTIKQARAVDLKRADLAPIQAFLPPPICSGRSGTGPTS